MGCASRKRFFNFEIRRADLFSYPEWNGKDCLLFCATLDGKWIEVPIGETEVSHLAKWLTDYSIKMKKEKHVALINKRRAALNKAIKNMKDIK